MLFLINVFSISWTFRFNAFLINALLSFNHTYWMYTLQALVSKCQWLTTFLFITQAQLREGIWHMLTISRLGNQYFQSTTPWKLAKSADAADKVRAASVVGKFLFKVYKTFTNSILTCTYLFVIVHPPLASYLTHITRYRCQCTDLKLY